MSPYSCSGNAFKRASNCSYVVRNALCPQNFLTGARKGFGDLDSEPTLTGLNATFCLLEAHVRPLSGCLDVRVLKSFEPLEPRDDCYTLSASYRGSNHLSESGDAEYHEVEGAGLEVLVDVGDRPKHEASRRGIRAQQAHQHVRCQ